MRIAFAGNPNSGKTTMYNALTGRSEKVGNWGGVTVGMKEYPIKSEYTGGTEAIAVDLPGAYSMSPFTPEEGITSEYVRDEHPDAIVNIVDATNLSRSLFFTTQLLELGIPVVVALNKDDINQKEGTKIDEKSLSQKLNCPVIKTTATEQKGLKDVIAAAVALNGKSQKAPYLQADIDLHDKNAVDAEDRKRFGYVNDLVKNVEERAVKSSETTKSDKVDAVLTNPIVGIIIFAAVMFGVFWVSQTWLGPLVADWLVGYINIFQEWVASQLEATPLLSTRLPAPGHDHVLPHSPSRGLRIHGACQRGHGSDLQESRSVGQIGHSHSHRDRMRRPRDNGLPYHSRREGKKSHRDALHLHSLRRQDSCHRSVCRRVLQRSGMGQHGIILPRSRTHIPRSTSRKGSYRL